MPQWTEDQQKVIASTAGKLICSAAAGSGKTAVMIERIVRLIREGVDPFSFLVITFTNAAAAEMKEKIRIFDIGPTIGAHTGPGTVAIGFWGREKER